MNKSFLKFGAYVGSLPVLFLPVSVLAAALPPGQGIQGAQQSLTTIKEQSGVGTGAQELPTLIGRIIGLVVGVVGILLVVRIVQAGILYMTSAGDGKKVDEAKKLMVQNVIGIVIIVSAYAISSFVINQIATATGSV
jgi:hypothetical protein